MRIAIATAQSRQRVDNTPGDDNKKKIVDELNAYKKSLADDTALELSEEYDKGANPRILFCRTA